VPALAPPLVELDDELRPETPVQLEHGETMVPGYRRTPLYTQWWRPFESRGSVLIVHGLKDHSARYGALAEQLVAEGFAVHAYDLRGHARSAGARAWVDSFDDHLRDLDAVVRHVLWREHGAGGGRMFLFGQGMGGAIAALWTLRRAPPLAGLVLSAAALQCDDAPLEARATRMLAALAPYTRILQTDLRRASRDRGTVEDSLRDALVHQAPAPARTARELLDAMSAIDAQTPELTVPLLAMHGSADPIQSSQGSRRLIARARSVDKQLYLYDGLAHDLLHEPERARVMRDVSTWMAERSIPTP
jgi:alpha-beta hydrolase superfamily lysophospholipase